VSQSQKEAAEYAEVLLAYSRGETIQMRRDDERVDNEWSDLHYPLWDFGRFEYRVAPKPVEYWRWKYPDGFLGTTQDSKDELMAIYAETPGRPLLMREVTE